MKVMANKISNEDAETKTFIANLFVAPLSEASANILRVIGLIFRTELTTIFPAKYIICVNL